MFNRGFLLYASFALGYSGEWERAVSAVSDSVLKRWNFFSCLFLYRMTKIFYTFLLLNEQKYISFGIFWLIWAHRFERTGPFWLDGFEKNVSWNLQQKTASGFWEREQRDNLKFKKRFSKSCLSFSQLKIINLSQNKPKIAIAVAALVGWRPPKSPQGNAIVG